MFFFAFSQTWYLVEILYLSELTANIEFWAKPLNCPIAQFLCVLNKGVDIMTLNVTSSSSVYTSTTESFLIDADKLECSQERPKIQEWAILNLLILLVFNSNLKSLITSLCAVSSLYLWVLIRTLMLISIRICCQISLERPRWQFSWPCSLESYHKANLEGGL